MSRIKLNKSELSEMVKRSIRKVLKEDNSIYPEDREFDSENDLNSDLASEIVDNQSINSVLESYLESLIWSSDEEFDGYSIDDIDSNSIDKSRQDIIRFIGLVESTPGAQEELNSYDEKSLGHNLALSRNGHGAGFFDDNNDILEDLARNFGEADLYAGDDGRLYIMGAEGGVSESKKLKLKKSELTEMVKKTILKVLKEGYHEGSTPDVSPVGYEIGSQYYYANDNNLRGVVFVIDNIENGTVSAYSNNNYQDNPSTNELNNALTSGSIRLKQVNESKKIFKVKLNELKNIIGSVIKEDEDLFKTFGDIYNPNKLDSNQQLPKSKNYDLKEYIFEVYMKNPETGEGGWDIKFVLVVAQDITKAKQVLKNNPLFDIIITREVIGYLNSNDLSEKEREASINGIWGDDPNDIQTDGYINESIFDDNEGEFIPHGSYTVSNSGGYLIMISDDGEMAKVKDSFGSDNSEVSDWLPIEYIPSDDEFDENGESEMIPVIDPEGYNIPLNQVMRINENKIKNKNSLKESHDDLVEFDIPSWAISALINGDYSGLDDEDEEKLNNFTQRVKKQFGNALFMMDDIEGEDNLGFRPYNDIDNLGDNVYRLYIRPDKVSENKKVKLSRKELSEMVKRSINKVLKEQKLNEISHGLANRAATKAFKTSDEIGYRDELAMGKRWKQATVFSDYISPEIKPYIDKLGIRNISNSHGTTVLYFPTTEEYQEFKLTITQDSYKTDQSGVLQKLPENKVRLLLTLIKKIQSQLKI